MPKLYPGGKYSYMADWVVLSRYEDHYIALNGLTEVEYELSLREGDYLKKLNGKRDELRIRGFSGEECEEYFGDMAEKLMIRPGGRYLNVGGDHIWTIYIPRKKTSVSPIPKVLDFLLRMLFLPVFILALWNIDKYDVGYFSYWDNVVLEMVIGTLAGLVLGMVLHECAHAFSALCDPDGLFFEAGVGIKGVMPCAYVMINTGRIKSRLRKIQINLAGVEMNLLISGILLNLLCFIRHNGLPEIMNGVILYAAIQNLFLFFLNICFGKGFDGENVISDLLGGDVVDAAKHSFRRLLRKKKRRLYFKKNGIDAVARIGIDIAVFAFQLVVPVVLVLSVIALVELFLFI